MKAIQKEAETKVVVQSEEERPNPPDMATPNSYFYAVLNDSDIVVEVTSTPFPAPPDYTQYIQINTLDETLIGKKYNRVTGTFEEVALDIKCDASNVTFKHNPARSVENKIAEYFVSTNKDTGMFAVTYELLVLPLVLSVQDLTKRVEELETRV